MMTCCTSWSICSNEYSARAHVNDFTLAVPCSADADESKTSQHLDLQHLPHLPHMPHMPHMPHVLHLLHLLQAHEFS